MPWNYASGLHHIYTFAEATPFATMPHEHAAAGSSFMYLFFLSALLLKHLLPMAEILLSSLVKKAGVLD